MDFHSLPLHPAEPGHLSLRELVYCIGQEQLHFIEAEDSEHVLRNELVLKTIIHKILRTHSPVNQPPHLVHQTFPNPRIQSSVNPAVPLLAAHQSADIESLLREEAGPRDRMGLLIKSYLNGPYSPFPRINVSSIVERLQ